MSCDKISFAMELCGVGDDDDDGGRRKGRVPEVSLSSLGIETKFTNATVGQPPFVSDVFRHLRVEYLLRWLFPHLNFPPKFNSGSRGRFIVFVVLEGQDRNPGSIQSEVA